MIANAARQMARTQVRSMNTAAKAAEFPYKGISDGGHLPTLQKEALKEKFLNWRAAPEIVPTAACVLFACGLSIYKMTVVDTFNMPVMFPNGKILD